MNQTTIVSWIEQSGSPDQKELRQAIHMVLMAISKSPFLQANMIMKGGVLLAIRFKSTRHTKDIDFSSPELFSDFDENKLLTELEIGLILAGEILDYALDCKIQSYKLSPAKEDATFQTLSINIGYARKGTAKHKKLMLKKSPSILSIDFSFNEHNLAVDILDLDGGAKIKAYSLIDLTGEKYRAIIQQKYRNRTRRQDAYDIYVLLKNGYLDDQNLKTQILMSLKTKAASRDLNIDKHTLRDPDIVKRSRKEYEDLALEIVEELPPFDKVYGMVADFYESLPW